MSIVKLGLAKMSVPEKIQFARQVAAALEENVVIFADSPFSYGDVLDSVLELEGAFNDARTARQQALEKTTLQNDFEASMNFKLTQVGIYAQKISGGDAVTIALAGMGVRFAPSPVGRLPMPSGVAVVSGPGAGELVLRWKALRGAKSYYVEQLADGASPEAWTSAATSTKAKAKVKGLVSGRKYWFRVAAIGTAGQGAWSEAVGMRAG